MQERYGQMNDKLFDANKQLKEKNRQCTIESEKAKFGLSVAQQALSVDAQTGRYSVKRADNEEEQKRSTLQLLAEVKEENDKLQHQVMELEMKKKMQ